MAISTNADYITVFVTELKSIRMSSVCLAGGAVAVWCLPRAVNISELLLEQKEVCDVWTLPVLHILSLHLSSESRVCLPDVFEARRRLLFSSLSVQALHGYAAVLLRTSFLWRRCQTSLHLGSDPRSDREFVPMKEKTHASSPEEPLI